MLEMRAFVDVASPAKVGVAWVELYGEKGVPEITSATMCKTLQTDHQVIPALASLNVTTTTASSVALHPKVKPPQKPAV
jgi:hypothetical protein